MRAILITWQTSLDKNLISICRCQSQLDTNDEAEEEAEVGPTVDSRVNAETHSHTHTHRHFWLLLSKLKLLDNYCLLYLSRGKRNLAHRRGLRTIQEKHSKHAPPPNPPTHSRFQVCVSWSSLGRIVIISAYLLFESFRLIECQTLEKVSRPDTPYRLILNAWALFSLDCLVIDKMLQVYTSV